MPRASNKPKQKQVKGPKILKLRKDSRSLGHDKPVTDQQERFALEYLKDFDRLRALAAAGYKVTNVKSAQATASYLLNLPNVRTLVSRKKMELAEQMGMDAANTLGYMKAVFVDAFSVGDYSGAIRALTEIGRVYGIYEADNTQRRKSPEDIARMKAQLEAMGMDFTRKNFPPHLVGVPPGEQPPQLLPADVLIVDNVRQSDANGHDDTTDVRGVTHEATGADDRSAKSREGTTGYDVRGCGDNG